MNQAVVMDGPGENCVLSSSRVGSAGSVQAHLSAHGELVLSFSLALALASACLVDASLAFCQMCTAARTCTDVVPKCHLCLRTFSGFLTPVYVLFLACAVL